MTAAKPRIISLLFDLTLLKEYKIGVAFAFNKSRCTASALKMRWMGLVFVFSRQPVLFVKTI